MNDLHEMAANSREAAWTLAASSLETRNAALLRMAEVLENHQADIFAANAADIHQAEADGLAAPLLGRLKFRPCEPFNGQIGFIRLFFQAIPRTASASDAR